MRASRLVQLLLLLQARGRTTAAVLARELEVSERTIHRDVDALSAAGVPIYAERGPHGGIQLVDGYRTRLTGLTGDEAEALFLSGLPGPAAELGLGTVVAAARLKVLAALPSELRARASRLVERFHLDATGWFQPSDAVPHLATLAEAVWEGRVATVRYGRGVRSVERDLQPLGLVLKAGIWYLVALSEDRVRTFRVSRFVAASVGEHAVTRPPGFDLPAYWAESIQLYEREAPRVTVTVRVDPAVISALADAVGYGAIRNAERLEADDVEGWLHLRFTADWPEEVPGRLIGLGSRAEILDPLEVRERAILLARRMLERHGVLSEGADHGRDHRDDQPSDNGHDADHQAHDRANREPLVARRGLRALHPATHEIQVAGVRLEPQVEGVAEDRNGADHEVDGRVRQHAGHDDSRQPHA
jgi:predicted DNA-binding transcriptional regulator YafY